MAGVALAANAPHDFPNWRDGAPTPKALTAYVNDITNAKSAHFVPVKDRIAVFDMDGTLLSETTPSYFDWTSWVYDNAENPPENTPEAIKQYAKDAKASIEAGNGMPRFTLGETLPAWAQTYAGMSLTDFDAKANQAAERLTTKGIRFKDSFFKPMLDVVKYLQKHHFTVYVVTGSDAQLVRNLIRDRIDIAPSQVIGSEVDVEVAHQSIDETRGAHYDLRLTDTLVRGGQIRQNLHFNKVVQMVQKIGARPVLSFGNSSGDYSMNVYTQQNTYPTKVFMLLCDDMERAACPKRDLEKAKAHYAEAQWNAISIKDEFKTVYLKEPKK